MKKFIVSLREVHTQGQAVEAETKEEAIQKVVNGEGTIVESLFEYSHTLGAETWTVEEVRDEPQKTGD